MAEIRSSLGRHQAKPMDAEAAKRRGWREHGILAGGEDDHRLTSPERALVRRLGWKLYGPRPEGGRRG